MGTKKGRIYGKGALFKEAPQKFRGLVSQTTPPGSATATRCVLNMSPPALRGRRLWSSGPQPGGSARQ